MQERLSVWGMFAAADIEVQTVMVGLLLASLAVWTLLIAKSLEIGAARRALSAALESLGPSPRISAAPEEVSSPIVTALIRDARSEMAASEGADDKPALLERLSSALERRAAGEARRIAAGTGVLATIGSTAPFVGLFGTVWGIMNSFIGIAETKTTTLAVVAPGIAEALLATACGLVVAIPAVVIYNHFSRAIGAYRAQVGDAAALVQRLCSRELDAGLCARVARNTAI